MASNLPKKFSPAITGHTYVSTEGTMKLVLQDMSSSDRQRYEREKGPLHPWTPRMDDRTGFSFCALCLERGLAWGQNKSVHSTYQIKEEIDFPWDK